MRHYRRRGPRLFRVRSPWSIAKSRSAARTREAQKRFYRNHDVMAISLVTMIVVSALVGAVEFSVIVGIVLVGYLAITRRRVVVSEPVQKPAPILQLTPEQQQQQRDEIKLAEWERYVRSQKDYKPTIWDKNRH